jgi:hypothetical protein
MEKGKFNNFENLSWSDIEDHPIIETCSHCESTNITITETLTGSRNPTGKAHISCKSCYRLLGFAKVKKEYIDNRKNICNNLNKSL